MNGLETFSRDEREGVWVRVTGPGHIVPQKIIRLHNTYHDENIGELAKVVTSALDVARSLSEALPVESKNVMETCRTLLTEIHLTRQDRAAVVRQLPTPFAIGMMLLPSKDRDEILADLGEWYQEIEETRGTGWANLIVFKKLVSAFGGQMLSVLERIAGIIGKVRAQK